MLSVASWFLLRQSLDSLLRHELDERIDDVQGFLSTHPSEMDLEILRAELMREYRFRDEGKWLQILDDHSNWLYFSSRGAIANPILPLPPAPGELVVFTVSGQHRLRTLTRFVTAHQRPYSVSMAISADNSRVTLANFKRDLLLMVPAVPLFLPFCS